MSYQPNFFKQLFHNSRRLTAKIWLSFMPTTQIAITGSQGKTNTTSTLFHVLSSLAPTVRTGFDLDTLYNVPITALHINPWTKYAIFELGVDRPGEMDTHLEIVNPKLAVITGISPVHTDAQHLGSMDALIKEKRRLIEKLSCDGLAILNGDDTYVTRMAPHTKSRVLFFGQSANNDVKAVDISHSLEGIDFTIEDTYFVPARPTRLHVMAPLIGKHHIYDVMVTYIIYRVLGYTDLSLFQRTLTHLKPLKGRMSLEKGPGETLLLNDSLRANPASTVSGLETLSEIHYKKGRKMAVLAEMGELEKPAEEHTDLGKHIAGINLDYIITIGKLHRNTVDQAIRHGFPARNIHAVNDVLEAGRFLKSYIQKGDLLYLKGSFLRKIERIPMILNGEEVGCNVHICPFYHHCDTCKYKKIGLKNKHL